MATIEARIDADNLQADIFKEASRPVTLKFENIFYKITIRNNKQFIRSRVKSKGKMILKGITGIVKPGEILAMLGPSGSGKTTLLTALGGRIVEGKLSGKISYNNKTFSNSTKRNTGFVTQDDVMYPHLTVTETLVFTALLRLPNSLSTQEKIMQAEGMITQLGLTKCKNAIIGGPFVRGISGGERKRVSIGQEMLINPSLLLLDEPTSGLDSTTAQRIVSTLWELAIGGRTIVMTIHQPSSQLFYMFNKVLLLCEGSPLYYGEGLSAMDYFESIGYEPSIAMNPSDFMLDLANGIASDDSREDRINTIKQRLVSAYKINLAEKLKLELEALIDTKHVENEEFAKFATTWGQQFMVLLKRGVKERRHESFSSLKVGQVLAVALVCGLLWWQTDVEHLQDKVGLLFFYTALWGIYPLQEALFTFPQERKMLEKERSSGTYRLSSYFIARIIGDLPIELVLPTTFLTITYFMAGLKPTITNFLHTLLVLQLNVQVARGLGFCLGALFMDQKSASVFGSVTMLSSMLAGGYFVTHVPRFISWIKYLSISNYTFKLLIGSQFRASERYDCGGDGLICVVGEHPAIGKIRFDNQGFAVLALVIMLVGYRVLAYIALMRVGVTK